MSHWRWDFYRWRFDQRVFMKLLFSGKRKFNIGADKFSIAGEWVETDIEVLDITNQADWARKCKFLRLDNIMAEHVWEHLREDETKRANANCFKYLKSGGRLRIAVPDGYHPDQEYIDAVKPGGSGWGSDTHRLLYTYKIMTERLEAAGFKVDLLEYWNEKGEFITKPWDAEHGFIHRSKNDKRNVDGKLVYTSLIVDAIKP